MARGGQTMTAGEAGGGTTKTGSREQEGKAERASGCGHRVVAAGDPEEQGLKPDDAHLIPLQQAVTRLRPGAYLREYETKHGPRWTVLVPLRTYHGQEGGVCLGGWHPSRLGAWAAALRKLQPRQRKARAPYRRPPIPCRTCGTPDSRHHSRGCCPKCYALHRNAVVAGRVTWEDLERQGWTREVTR